MKIKHENTVNLGKEEIRKILIKALGLPDDTKAEFDLVTTGDDRFGTEYKIFGSVRLIHTTERDI